MRIVATISLLPLLLLALAGCDDASQAKQAPAASARTRAAAQAAPEGHGMIRGSIKFIGTPPPMKSITPNDSCCADGPALHDETVVVNPNGTLRNTFVYLEDAPAVDGNAQPPVLLDQVHCRYVPHVIGVQVGQTLRIRSSDPTMHNVHFNPEINPAHNFAMTQPGQQAQTKFLAPEFIRFKCDVHPWMTAWVGVFDSPFFSVTQDDGDFQIRNVPAGTYKLVAWHELYGKLEQSVTVTDDQTTNVTLTYKGN